MWSKIKQDERDEQYQYLKDRVSIQHEIIKRQDTLFKKRQAKIEQKCWQVWYWCSHMLVLVRSLFTTDAIYHWHLITYSCTTLIFTTKGMAFVVMKLWCNLHNKFIAPLNINLFCVVNVIRSFQKLQFEQSSYFIYSWASDYFESWEINLSKWHVVQSSEKISQCNSCTILAALFCFIFYPEAAMDSSAITNYCKHQQMLCVILYHKIIYSNVISLCAKFHLINNLKLTFVFICILIIFLFFEEFRDSKTL